MHGKKEHNNKRHQIIQTAAWLGIGCKAFLQDCCLKVSLKYSHKVHVTWATTVLQSLAPRESHCGDDMDGERAATWTIVETEAKMYR